MKVRLTDIKIKEINVDNARLTLHNVDTLLERIIHASREIVFFFGSALSIPETDDMPGVPNVAGILTLIEARLKNSPNAFSPVRGINNVGQAYQKAFEQLQAFRGQDAANEVIRHAVIHARKPIISASVEIEPPNLSDSAVCRALDDDIAGWYLRPSLIALGTLLAKHSGRVGKTVLTTNFDPLIQVAVRTAHGTYLRTMLHDDGKLSQSEGPGVQIVHLHGYWHGTDTLHVPAQISRPRTNLKRSLESLLQNRTLIVMGCGGWDDVFMSSLSDLVKDSELNPDVLWTFYESDEKEIATKYQHILSSLTPAMGRVRVNFYGGVNIHTFLPNLLERLKNSPDTDEQCAGQVFSDSAIGCLIADCCSKALGGRLPSLECSRTLL